MTSQSVQKRLPGSQGVDGVLPLMGYTERGGRDTFLPFSGFRYIKGKGSIRKGRELSSCNSFHNFLLRV